MKKNTKRMLVCIYFILLCCVFLFSAFSKNLSQISGNGEMELANIKLNVVKQTESISNLANTYQNISFIVNNYDGTKENPVYNDTEYKYQIAISFKKNIPFEYELYKVENGTESKIALTNNKSTEFVMPHSEIKEDKFILKVKLSDNNYRNMEDDLNIEVYAVQE